MTRSTWIRTLAVGAVVSAAVIVVAAPARLAAQLDTVIVNQAANPRADKVEARAEMLLGAGGRWREAAALYLQAAGLRAPDDPRASVSLQRAANLFFALQDLEAARQASVKAGELAQARGDVLVAASAYVDAGWLAGQRGDRANMRYYSERARVLASSPLITTAQRNAILRRVGDMAVAGSAPVASAP
jgi:tetratricopeptide (TPR) repeat protein